MRRKAFTAARMVSMWMPTVQLLLVARYPWRQRRFFATSPSLEVWFVWAALRGGLEAWLTEKSQNFDAQV